MRLTSFRNKILPTLTLGVALTALAVLCGWILHIAAIVQLRPQYAPMQFNAALCFLLSSLSLLSRGHRAEKIGTYLSVVAFGIGIITFAEYLLDTSWGIDTFFLDPFVTTNSPHPGRMAPGSAAGFVLLNAGLMVSLLPGTKGKTASFTAATCGGLAAALGCVGVLGYALGIDTAIMENATRMAPHTAIGFIILGSTLALTEWIARRDYPMWLPLPIAAALLTVTISLTAAAWTQDQKAISSEMLRGAEDAASRSQDWLREMHRAIDRIGKRWEAARGTPRQQWERDAEAYSMAYAPYLTALEWIDTDLRVRWVVPLKGNETVIGKILRSGPERSAGFDEALKTGMPVTTLTFPLFQGGRGYLHLNPLFVDKRFDGMLVAVIRTTPLFETILRSNSSTRYFATVKDQRGYTLYSSLPRDYSGPSDLIKSVLVKNGDDVWTLTVYPRPTFLAQRQSDIPEIFLVTGSIISCILSFAVFLALKWHSNARSLHASRKELEISEERYALAVSGAAAGLWDWDLLSGKMFWSERFLHILGIQTPGFESSPAFFNERLHPEDRARVNGAIQAHLCSGAPYDVEYRLQHQAGHYIWIRARGQALWNENGKPIRMAGSAEDISERRRVSEQLVASLKLNDAVLSSAPYLIIATDLNGRVILFNREAENALGYKAEEIIGKETPALWHDLGEITRHAEALSAELGEYVPPGFSAFTARLDRGLPEQGEWTFRRRDGTTFPGYLVASKIAAGNTSGYLGVVRDLTQQKAAEKALEDRDNLLRTIVDNTLEGIFVLDDKGHIRAFNPACEQLYGYSREEVIGLDIDMLIPPEFHRRGAFAEEVHRYLGLTVEAAGLRKDGSVFPIEISSNSAVIDGKQIYSSVLRDISDRKAADKLKNEFVSTVSHELRTPLTSIRGALSLLKSGVPSKIPGKTEELLGIAYQNSGRLLRLINDILDIEKLEAGRLEFAIAPARLNALLRQAIEVNQPYGDRYQVAFVLNEPDTDLLVLVDADRFAQIMANLLSNGAKFSPKGANVEVSARIANGMVRVSVRDYGIGIPDKFRKDIFGKFAQADNSSTRSYEGTGLGLSIVKKLAEGMGGNVGFTSVVGKGSTFYVDLPLASADDQMKEAS